MNKTDLVNAVYDAGYERGDIQSRAAAERIVNDVLTAMKNGIADEGELKLAGFGNFTVYERKERKGNNPQTGKVMTIPATNAIRFHAASALKDAVANL